MHGSHFLIQGQVGCGATERGSERDDQMAGRSVGGVNPLSFAFPKWLFNTLSADTRHGLIDPPFQELKKKKGAVRKAQ